MPSGLRASPLVVTKNNAACCARALSDSGTLRSDTIHPAGPLTMRDLVAILPMLDETVVLEASGQVVLDALENGVCKWPALEGRFLQVSRPAFRKQRLSGSSVPLWLTSEHRRHLALFSQVSGVRFDFDPANPPGKRVVLDSVFVGGRPLDLQKTYKLATKAYMALGKDGFDCLLGLKVNVACRRESRSRQRGCGCLTPS